MQLMRYTLLILAATLTAAVHAEVKTMEIDYQDGSVQLQGFLAYDDAKTQKPAPGVLIVPEWWGHDDYVRGRAKQVAELGYVAFALDMYGKGVKTNDPKEAGKLATQFYMDRNLMRSRAAAGLNVLKSQKNVDPARIAAIGYCFGGSTALELARGGAPLAGVVSFHGGLDFPIAEDNKNIKGKLLICTGADDPMVTQEKVNTFESQLRAAKVNYQINVYSGAVHAFTNPQADSHKIPGIAYNAQADQRSWRAMVDFFAEVFGERK